MEPKRPRFLCNAKFELLGVIGYVSILKAVSRLGVYAPYCRNRWLRSQDPWSGRRCWDH